VAWVGSPWFNDSWVCLEQNLGTPLPLAVPYKRRIALTADQNSFSTCGYISALVFLVAYRCYCLSGKLMGWVQRLGSSVLVVPGDRMNVHVAMFVAELGCWICYSGLSHLQSDVSCVSKPIDINEFRPVSSLGFVRPLVPVLL
jgi:hypothetical protein